MKTLFEKVMFNENGTSLMEVVVGILIVSTVTTAVLISYVSGHSTNYQIMEEYDRVTVMYDHMEGNVEESLDLEVEPGSITFSWGPDSDTTVGGTITVDGYYDFDEKQMKLGEFTYDVEVEVE